MALPLPFPPHQPTERDIQRTRVESVEGNGCREGKGEGGKVGVSVRRSKASGTALSLSPKGGILLGGFGVEPPLQHRNQGSPQGLAKVCAYCSVCTCLCTIARTCVYASWYTEVSIPPETMKPSSPPLFQNIFPKICLFIHQFLMTLF